MTDRQRQDLRRVNLKVKGLILMARFQTGQEQRNTLAEALLQYGYYLAHYAN